MTSETIDWLFLLTNMTKLEAKPMSAPVDGDLK